MIVDELREALGPAKVLSDAASLHARRRDAWVLNELDDLEGIELTLPECVVLPAVLEDVVTVVQRCRQTGTAIVPVGLRSGVCGGVRAGKGSVIVDLSTMARVRSVDPHNLIGSFDAGLRGSAAEKEVARHGLTLGHFPQSMELSSVGGWVATRAAGQFSTGYGNIEDIVLGLEAVLPDGSIFQSGNAPRASTGPDLRHLLLGSEGTLGVITGVSLALRRAAEARQCAAYYLPDMGTGFEAQRQILQSGWAPVVLRQYDAREVGRLFGKFRRGGDGLLLVVHEGPSEKVMAEMRAVERLALAAGCSLAPAEATEHWLAERNRVPSFKSFLQSGVIVDTVEVAADYGRIGKLYDDAVHYLSRVEGIWNGSAHSSHAYRTGINLYFSFAVQPKDRGDLRRAYRECWDAIMRATLQAGGTISHHHGIGRVRRDWLARELGPGQLQALRAVKAAIDPAGIMNPGALLPDGP